MKKSQFLINHIQGCGVGGVACFQLESESFFFKLLESGVGVGFSKNAGVGVSFSKLLESESRVGILKNLLTPQPWSYQFLSWRLQ